MRQKTIREISVAWKEYKQPYVKQSTMAAYVLILENHILPNFGESDTLHEQAVQDFVLRKIENGLSVKSVKDILIVLKMVMKFGVKNEWMDYQEWDIKYRLLQQPKNWKYCQLPITRKYSIIFKTISPLPDWVSTSVFVQDFVLGKFAL